MAKKSRPHSQNNTLFIFSIMAFLLISTNALVLNKMLKPLQTVTVIDRDSEPIASIAPLPVLGAQTSNDIPEFTASSIIAIDAESGVTLFEKNPDAKLFPASTTKIITALVALDSYSLNDVVTVRNINVVGQKMGLVEGEQLTVRDLLQGMLILSANDAAEALANYYPGGRPAFIIRMNLKAKELNMSNSNFTNPSGLEDIAHLSTARDMARAAGAAMENKTFAQMVSTKKTTVTSIDGSKKHVLSNINKLIGTVDGVLGVKTGFTENARENLVTYVERDKKRVIISLLGSEDRFGETTKIIEWIYKKFKWEDIELP